jgi:hypothetical protein
MVLLDPASLDFGNRSLGSASAPSPVTLTNSGDGSLHISSIAIDGTTDFSQTNNCGSTLAAAASCTVQVTFTPSVTGVDEASLLVTDSAGGSPQSVTLSGSGGTIPVASVTPASVIFGSQDVGTRSAASVIAFSNKGSDVLAITDIAISGNNADDFTQTNNCGGSLAAGASCNISVVFAPTGGGSRIASILISDNAPGSPRSINVSGTASDFLLAGVQGNQTATVTAGQTATYHLELTPENGFSGNVTIACSDAAPLSSCTASQSGPFSVNGDAVDFTLQVSTTGTAKTAGLSLLLPLAAFAFIACVRRPWRKAATSAFLLCLFFTSCGGGSSSAPPAPKVTPVGSYMITVNATAAGVTHPIHLTLNVQ